MAKNYIFPDKFLGQELPLSLICFSFVFLQARRLRYTMLPLGLICFLFILGQNGCGITASPKVSRSLKEPVPPLAGEVVTRLYQQARSKCDNAMPVVGGKDGVSELVLTCVSAGRDFCEPKGPDGFVLKVTPLDRHYQTVQAAANITIILYGAQGEQDRNTSLKYRKVPPKYRKAPPGRPLRLWYVPANELADYWMPSRLLNGFLFRLEWVREVPPGDYILSVIYERQERAGTQAICQEVFFCK